MKVKKDGQLIQIQNWYADCWFRGKKYKVPLFRNLSESERFGDKLDALVGAVSAGQSPDSQQHAWLSQLPPKMLQRLAKIGLVEQSRVEASKDLSTFIDDYKASLTHRGNTQNHVKRTIMRINRICDSCGFQKISDIDSQKTERYLSEQLKAENLHPNTTNNFVHSLKAFGNFLVQADTVEKNPFRNLRQTKVTERKRPRRPLSPEELTAIIQYTKKADAVYGLSGHERSFLYRFAACTGLRVGEIRTLTVGDFNADEKTITVEARFAKNRKKATLPLRSDVVMELQELTAGKLPTLPLFNRIDQYAARMLRVDVAGARAVYVASGGRDAAFLKTEGIDFHSLRYSFASMLVNSDVAPRTAMELLRHSDVRLTMQLYGKSYKSLEQSAVDGLPSFDKPKMEVKKA